MLVLSFAEGNKVILKSLLSSHTFYHVRDISLNLVTLDETLRVLKAFVVLEGSRKHSGRAFTHVVINYHVVFCTELFSLDLFEDSLSWIDKVDNELKVFGCTKALIHDIINAALTLTTDLERFLLLASLRIVAATVPGRSLNALWYTTKHGIFLFGNP